MTMRRFVSAAGLTLISTFCLVRQAPAQDLFEIQVYPYDTVEPRRTMVELHTNFVASGTKEAPAGEFPMHQQVHTTLEVTHGFSKYFECAGYLVTAAYVPDHGAQFAGARIRPRFRFPDASGFPFKVSLSFELGFNQPEFEVNTRTLEIRPILERQEGRFYLSINPDFSKALRGPDSGAGIEFEPGVKVAWDVTPKIAAGIEYYAATGVITNFERLHDQHHMIFPTLDLNVSPDWELNFAVGRGLTGSSEQWVIKSIVGYKFKH